MRKIQTLFFSLLAMTLVFSSCGKYNEGPFISLKSKEKRIATSWKLDKMIVDGKDKKLKEDLLIQEDIITMAKDGAFTFKTTNIIGGISEGKGKWEFIQDDTKIKLAIDGGSTTDLTILKLSSKEFWFTYKEGTSVIEQRRKK